MQGRSRRKTIGNYIRKKQPDRIRLHAEVAQQARARDYWIPKVAGSNPALCARASVTPIKIQQAGADNPAAVLFQRLTAGKDRHLHARWWKR